MAVTEKGWMILLLIETLSLQLGVCLYYHYVPLPKNWNEAQRYCRENHVDLATIETPDDWARVRQILQNSFTWIGLFYDINAWRWSIDNTYLYGEGNTEFGEWFAFATDNSGGTENCAEIVAGNLNDRSCDAYIKSVCYDESTKTYIAVTNPMTWRAARDYCRQKYTDLTSMRNQQEKEAIMSVIDQSHWWAGLYRDVWRWSHQSNTSLRVWDTNQPDGYGKSGCVGTHKQGWHDYFCNYEYPFVCSVPAMKLFKVVLKVEGSLDLDNPSVQEGVLNHIEKHMRDHGIHHKLKLSWRKSPNGKVFEKREAEPPL